MRVYDAHVAASANATGTPFTVDLARSRGRATIFQATVSGTATVSVLGRNSQSEDWSTLATFTASGAKLITPMQWMRVDISGVSGTPSVTTSGVYVPGVPTAVSAPAGAPEVDVLGNGVAIADGDASPTTADHTDFGTTTTDGSPISRTFTIRNIGTATLNISGLSVPAGYTVTASPAASLAPGGSTTFTVRLDTAVGGTKSGNISFSTNDSDEGTYNFAITGEVTALVAPTVALTAPADAGTSNSIPVTVTATATANAPATSITSVAFYANDILIGTDNSAPYSVSWSPPNGTYTLKAVATDNLGSVTHSATRTHTVSATVTTAPEPMYLELWDHSVPASPALVGTMSFIGADTSMTFSDPDINAELGTVPVKSASTISWGGFDWGALRFKCPGAVNATTPGTAFHQVLIFNKPNVNWANYPAASGYNKDVSETYPPAYKIIMKDTGGNVLYTWQMNDGLPINSWSINVGPQVPVGVTELSGVVYDNDAPIRHHVNCAQVLPWTQARCKQNAKAKWWYGGVAARGLRPSLVGKSYSSNPAFPPQALGSLGGTQSNGIMNHRYMPMNPRAKNHPAYTDPHSDPYLFNWWDIYPAENQGRTGHAYEPGNPAHIDMHTGIGGVRFDRGGFATPICEVISDPNLMHLGVNRSYRELLDHTMLNCFNIAFHFTGDVSTGAPAIDKTGTFLCGPNGSQGSATAWSYNQGFYLGSPSPYVAGGLSKTINEVAMGQGAFFTSVAQELERYYKRDATTQKIRRPWGGWCFDHMHAHQFWGACAGLFNSPMHAWHNLHSIWSCMLTNNNQSWDNYASVRPTGWWAASEFSYAGIMTRERAYRFMHLAMGWWLANNHPSFGISRADIQTELVRYIKTYHTGVYQKKWAAGSDNSPFWLGLRRFGMQLTPRLGTNYGDSQYYARLEDSPAGCYHIYPFALAAQTGLLDYLLGLGDTQVTESLTDMVANLDTYSVVGLLDAGYAQSVSITHRMSPIVSSFEAITAASLPANWAGLAAVAPPPGSASFLKNSSGAWAELSAWAHVQAMWAIGAHHYLRGHFPHARSTEAFNFIESVYADHYNNYVLGTADLKQRMIRDWTYLHPVHGPLAPPVP